MDNDFENVQSMTLATVKDFLVVDQDETDDDVLIKLFWNAAKARVETLTHRKFKEWIDAPADITLACLILTQHFYDKRSADNISMKVKLSVLDLIEPYYSYGDHWKKEAEEVEAAKKVYQEAENKTTGVSYTEWL